jgi:hypothetical protein
MFPLHWSTILCPSLFCFSLYLASLCNLPCCLTKPPSPLYYAFYYAFYSAMLSILLYCQSAPFRFIPLCAAQYCCGLPTPLIVFSTLFCPSFVPLFTILLYLCSILAQFCSALYVTTLFCPSLIPNLHSAMLSILLWSFLPINLHYAMYALHSALFAILL